MNTTDDNISVTMSNVTCTGHEFVLASCKRREGNHWCVDNIEAQALCEPSKLKSLKSLSPLFFSVFDEKLSHVWIQIKKKNN